MEMGHPGRRGDDLPAGRARDRRGGGRGRRTWCRRPCGAPSRPTCRSCPSPRCSATICASPGDAGDDGHQPLRHLHDEVQRAGPRAAAQRVRLAELHPLPARGHAAGRAGDRPRLRPDPARAFRHGPVRVPGRRRGRCRLHPRLRHPRLARRPAASSASATRSSPRSRPTPATPPPPRPPASRS